MEIHLMKCVHYDMIGKLTAPEEVLSVRVQVRQLHTDTMLCTDCPVCVLRCSTTLLASLTQLGWSSPSTPPSEPESSTLSSLLFLWESPLCHPLPVCLRFAQCELCSLPLDLVFASCSWWRRLDGELCTFWDWAEWQSALWSWPFLCCWWVEILMVWYPVLSKFIRPPPSARFVSPLPQIMIILVGLFQFSNLLFCKKKKKYIIVFLMLNYIIYTVIYMHSRKMMQ